MKQLFSFLFATLTVLFLSLDSTDAEAQVLRNSDNYRYHQAHYDLQLNGELGLTGRYASAIDTNLIMVVGDTAAVADTSKDAILDIRSLSRGVLLPRMAATQRAAIYQPPEGLLVFDTDSNKLCWYTGSLWKCATVPADP